MVLRRGLWFAFVLTSAIGFGAHTARAAVAWIANQGESSVSRLDLETHESVTVSVGAVPYGVAASPDGTRAYVTNPQAGTVVAIDAESMTVIETIPVGTEPQGIAVTPNGAKVYVALNDGQVVVIDGVALTVGIPIPVIGPDSWGDISGVAMNTAGTRVYVAKYERNVGSVAVLDTALDQVVADIFTSPSGYGAQAVSVSVDDTTVWVTGQGSGEVYEIDAATSLLARAIPLDCPSGCYDIWGVVPHPDGSRVYVTIADGQRVDVIDTAAGAVTSSIPLESYPITLDVTPDGDRLYVIAYADLARIEIVDTETESLIGSLISVGSDPIAFGRFITGEVEPDPVPPPPALSATARTCQDAIAGSWKRYPAKLHKTFASCFDRLIDDVASGAGSAAAAVVCVKNLDPGNASSSLSRMRATARAKILSGCAGVTPAQLALPCSEDATTLAEVADCVLDAQADNLAATLASEYGAPCSLATAAGLAAMHPALCTAAP